MGEQDTEEYCWNYPCVRAWTGVGELKNTKQDKVSDHTSIQMH